ncbi:leucyl aminopeptidase [Fodinicurvata halophila]|uniref:Probable cytosol aminopeptidase n=1 Tax=Fodinicurvata halophila TaxID=1419723 RepID=A0ABV8ULD2_9PROT
MQIGFSAPDIPGKGTLAITVLEDGKLGEAGADLDRKTGGSLTRALKASSRFKGKKSEFLDILAPQGVDLDRIVLAGIGNPSETSELDWEALGGNLLYHLNQAGVGEATLLFEAFDESQVAQDRAAALAGYGASLRSYRFDRYRTREKQEKKPTLETLTLALKDHKPADKLYKDLERTVPGIFMARDVISEPANVIYPESFVQEARKLEKLGVKIEVLGEAEMRERGMHALLGVGEGSQRDSQLLVMTWPGADKKGEPEFPVAFVGKGVCFDTGGISIKPAANMEDMKWDMGGAGVVLGLMHVLASRKAKVNAIGVCGLVENMPDGRAQRPGDIVTSMSGQTIEIINTDAEGRLVLADALWYVQERFKPKTVIDLATLTGAILVALGKSQAGLFSNNDELVESLENAGKNTSEAVWHMPMGEEFDQLLNTDSADMKNTGNRWGGSITAAQFLKRFIQEGVSWAHLDIAGVTWSEKDKPTVPKGATAHGVRLLDRYVADTFEK